MMKTLSRSIVLALTPLMPASMLMSGSLLFPAASMAQISVNVSVNVPPPELPVYDQPPIPGDGYIWTPGYWAWGDDIQDYYWVPGTWVEAPEPDYLWTPGYWGAEGAAFLWHAGYWGPQVGFYGGVNYGYGYGGNGYEGGYWQGGHLYYNRSVNNIGNIHVTNVYNKTVVNNVTVNRVSYNGGNGTRARPTADQEAAGRQRHVGATSVQQQHDQAARNNPSLRVSQNKGRPPIAATSRPGAFSGAGVVGSRGAAARPAGNSRPGADARPAGNPRPAGNSRAAGETDHPGTLSVVHPNTPARDAAPRDDARRQTPRTAPQDVQRERGSEEGQPRQVQPREEHRAPEPNQSRTPPEGRPNAPQPHPNVSRPEHAPEHQEDHEHR